MESQPQNPEFRNNPENFHPCKYSTKNRLIKLNQCMIKEQNDTVYPVKTWIRMDVNSVRRVFVVHSICRCGIGVGKKASCLQ